MVSNIWNDLKAGWSFIRADRLIWLAIVYLSTVQSALFIMTAIGIPYIGEKGLGLPQGDIIYVLAPMSVGLGLSVARGFTEAMGGTLTAEDTPGGGLTVVIALPAALPVGSHAAGRPS